MAQDQTLRGTVIETDGPPLAVLTEVSKVYRVSGYTRDDQEYIEYARERCSATIQRIAAERGIQPNQIGGWLAKACGVRWQTASNWALGKSYPRGRNLFALAKELGVEPEDVVPRVPVDIESNHPAWGEFARTEEGKTLSDEERHTLRFFAWASPPTLDDYHTLLFAYRNNARRS